MSDTIISILMLTGVLLTGGAVGGLAGNAIAGRGDKLLGTVIGAGAGALLGREVDRSKYRCR